MKKAIIIIFAIALAVPSFAQCDLELRKKGLDYGKGILLRDQFNIIERSETENPDKADFSIVLNKGTTYEYIFLTSDKFEGKISAKLVNVGFDKETKENFVNHVLFDLKQTYFVDGVMRATFTVPETAIYYLFVRTINEQKACAYIRLDYITNNRKKKENK